MKLCKLKEEQDLNLINEQVIHQSFGEGSVIEYTDSFIEIHFDSGNRKFIFPNAFGTYLTLIDKSAADSVKRMNQQREEKEHKQKELELEKENILRRAEKQRFLQEEKLKYNPKIHPISQAAFWCKSEEKNKIFTEWRVFTGLTKRGYNEGKPNKLIRIHQNSACLLTSIDPGMPEKDRRILGVYMVNEAFTGKLCEDGYITAHPEYRLRLSEEESKKMFFWNYYASEKYPNNMKWNTGKHYYFDNIWMAQILRDIVSMKNETQELEFAQHFFDHFCLMNRIEKKELQKPNGALMRI